MAATSGVGRYKDVGDAFVSPGGHRYYTPISKDAIKPQCGMLFDSFEQTFAFYQKYALSCGFSVRKSTKCKGRRGPGQLRYIVSTKEGFRKKKVVKASVDAQNVKATRNKASKRTGCLAKIRLRLINDNKFELYFFEEVHNHSFVSDEDIKFLTAARKVDHVKETAIQSLSAINIGPVRAFNVLKSLYGGYEQVGATKSDFKNYKRDLNQYIGEFDAEMIVQRLQQKKECLVNFSFDYLVNEDKMLKALFWADEVSKDNYSIFGDVVAFDATYRTNKYDMVFVPFTGIDNHNRNVTFGAALLGSETAKSYRWLLQKHLEAFKVAPNVIVTDQDPAMKRAIQDVFPNTRHRLCMWHIMEKVTGKVGPHLCNTTNIKKRLGEIVWSDSITTEEFEKNWSDILSTFDLSSHAWLNDTFNIRRDWIPAFYKEEKLSGLMRTTSRAESENHFFNHFCNPNSTFVEFYSRFEQAIEAQRYSHRKNDHETRYTMPDIWSVFPLERQAVQLFTQTIFLDQQLEIDNAIRNCSSGMIEKLDDFQKYYIKEIDDLSDTFFEVMFRKNDITLSCSCGRFEQFGLLCSHAFFVLRYCHITQFPDKYVHKRWRREIVGNCSLRSVPSSETGENDVEETVREIIANNEYVINRLVMNKEELYHYRDVVKSYMGKADAVQINYPAPSRKDGFVKTTGMNEPRHANVFVPARTRTKGCGTRKRLKSAREIAIKISEVKKNVTVSEANKKSRGCSTCKGIGHNTRTCPSNNKSVEGGCGSSGSKDN